MGTLVKGTKGRRMKKLNIKEEFIPILLMCIIGCLEFFAGILNILNLSTYLIGFIGIIFVLYKLYRIILKKEKINLNKNFIIYAFLVLWAAWILKGTILIHYDNFSHWAIIIKEMLTINKLPNFQSNVILFTSYPPGTACFIYFICKYIGTSEGIVLFAQSLIIISSLFTLFAFCNKENKINYLLVTIGIIYLLIANIFINQLLVDTVLPLLGIASIAIIIYYREDNKKSLFIITPILCFLTIVKNSGIFFVIIDFIIWFTFFIKNNGIKSVFKTKYILLIFLPLLMLLLWSAHTDLVFDNSNTTKHAMSIENYTTNLGNKDTEVIYNILNNMKNKMIDLNNKDNQIFLIMIIPFIVLIFISKKNIELQKFIIKMFIFYILSYVLYQISVARNVYFFYDRRRSRNFSRIC